MPARYTALILAASAAVAAPVQAQAQAAPAAAEPEAPPKKQQAEETIAVTGSRVRRKDLTSAAPVAVITREEIAASGVATIGDFLQQLPEQSGSLNSNVNNGGDGQAQVALRNLGALRTLVLVDGKRFVNGGSGPGANGTTAVGVDLNTIPTSAIERIEILKDGASAVYGADAVGGVVNIITRKRGSGTEVSIYSGISTHGDANVTDFSLTSSASSERGSFLLSGGYYRQDALFAGGRGWSNYALAYDYAHKVAAPGGSPTVPSGSATVSLDPSTCTTQLCAALRTAYPGIQTNGKWGSITLINNGSSPDPINDPAVQDPSRMGSYWRAFVNPPAPVNDYYNYQPINYLVTPSNRISLFANGDYHIEGAARAYMQASFVNRQSSYQLANEPLSSGAFGALGAGNPYNPFGEEVDSYRRRLVEADGRGAGFDISTFRIVSGFDGSLPEGAGPLAGTFWDVSFNYGRTSGSTIYRGSVNTSLTAQGLASDCGPSGNGAECVNIFAGQGALTPAMLSALGFYDGVSNGWNQMAALQVNLSKELFTLASTRPVGLAAGYEFRREYGGFQPDPIGVLGQSFDFNSHPTSGAFRVNEGYAELDVPIVSDLPLVDDLELQAATRFSDYSNFGSNATYKLGIRYRPVRDLTLRGTISSAFRAPSIVELYGGQAPSAEVANDPCAGRLDSRGNVQPLDPVADARLVAQCQAVQQKQGTSNAVSNLDNSQQITSTIGGNPQLTPEKATVQTLGAVFEPTSLKGFSATLDFWNVHLTQTVGTLTTGVILSGCYPAAQPGNTAPQNLADCNLVQRSAASGQIYNVFDLSQNIGVLDTNGVDVSFRYQLPTRVGRFGFLFDATYLLKYEVDLPTRSTPISSAGNYDAGSGLPAGGVTPRLKFNFGVDYGLEAFHAALRGRFIGGYSECGNSGGLSTGSPLCSDANADAAGNLYKREVPAYATFDLLLRYVLKNPVGDTTLSVGVRNLFNTDPPVVYSSYLTFTDPTYDFVGRYVYGRIDHKF